MEEIIGGYDSAHDLAKQFAKERAEGSVFDTGSVNAPLLHAQRPKCWICKKWVREMDEEVTPRGDHILTVRCCGKSAQMKMTRDQLIMMHDRGVKIDIGYAFAPEQEIGHDEKRRIAVEDGGTAIRVKDNQEKEQEEDYA